MPVLDLVVSTLLGVLFSGIAGLGKLLSCHPMYNTLRATFEKAIGPFFGISATLMRHILGVAELSAGLTFLFVPWGELLGLIPTALEPELQALLLCAISGMIIIMAGAFIFSVAVEWKREKTAPYVVFVGLLSILLYLRIQATDFEAMPVMWRRAISAFPCVCGVGMAFSIVSAVTYGVGIEETAKQMKDVEKLREQLLAK
mmetsp:Transcript_23339/g.43894  ORF Transcript_23339/g.43894 Transcript_23339/m.43894 type:complete len:201 (+) Transcript_23339:131-733(+)